MGLLLHGNVVELPLLPAPLDDTMALSFVA